MINSALFTPRNIAIIGLITVVTHVIAKPIFKAIDQGKNA